MLGGMKHIEPLVKVRRTRNGTVRGARELEQYIKY